MGEGIATGAGLFGERGGGASRMERNMAQVERAEKASGGGGR